MIQEKGSKKTVVTGPGGAFQLSVSSGRARLLVNYGSRAHRNFGDNRNDLSVIMKSVNESLSDVVVIGYATVKKKI